MGLSLLTLAWGCDASSTRPPASSSESAPPSSSADDGLPARPETEREPTTSPRTGSIEGFAIDGSSPMAGLLVQLIRSAALKYDTTTDEAGYFTVKEVPSGEYLLNVVDYAALRAGHFRMRQQPVWIGPGELLAVDLVFGQGARIRGTVSGLPDAPIHVIIARRLGGPAPEAVSPLDQDQQIESAKFLAASAKVEADGSYELEDLAPGTYMVEVLAQQREGETLSDFARRDRTPPARTEVTIVDEDLRLDLVAQ
ncbi:MAG: carboxypeptidase-like regulatory domain-containing protein [Planctomycetota bacterium]